MLDERRKITIRHDKQSRWKTEKRKAEEDMAEGLIEDVIYMGI